MKKYFNILFGLFFFCWGILFGSLEIVALLDPVGTKMADDSDPFGNPHIPWQQHAAFIIFVLGCFGLCYVFWRDVNKNPFKNK